MRSASKRYTVFFTIDTYKYEKARLLVTILVEDRDDVETLSEGGVIEADGGNQQKYSLPDGEEYDILLEVLKLELKEALRPDWLKQPGLEKYRNSHSKNYLRNLNARFPALPILTILLSQ